MTNHKTHTTLFALIAITLFTAAAMANTITLRTSVRLTGDSDAIHLRDIAEITGSEAAQYADVKIAVVTDPEQAMELHVRQIRQALDAEGIHWGRVNLNGSHVLVRPRGRPIGAPPLAMASVSIEVGDPTPGDRSKRQRDPMLASEIIEQRTLRGAIAQFLAANLAVAADQLRLEFDSRDDQMLDSPLVERGFEIEPVSSVSSNRVELAVRLWDDGRATERMTVRVSPTIHLPVVMMRRDVSRGSIVTEDDIEVVHQWMQPVHGGLVTSESEAVGRIATVRLSAGDSLREQHVRRETLVKRGDLVIVRALVGGSVLTMQAEARASGSEGDTIEFRKVGERDTFLATVTARNEAVVDLQR